MTFVNTLPLVPAARSVARNTPAFALAILVTLIGGCAAGGSTLGDEITAAGTQYAAIGERWDDGENKVVKGRKLISRSRKRIRDAEDDIERGERLVREGEQDMARSRREYDQLKSRTSTIGPAPGS